MSLIEAHLHIARVPHEVRAEFEVDAGEGLALIGPNGSGKSTLLDAIAGLVTPEPDSTLRIGDHTLATPPERRRVGVLSQDSGLFAHLDARDNVAFGPRAQGVKRADARALADDLLAQVGLHDFGDRRVTECSGGQRRRIALARALAAKPVVLLLDEPFAGLDVDAAAQMRELVSEVVQREQLALIVATHDLVDAARLASRVMVLERGEVVERCTPAQLQLAPASGFAASFAGLGRVVGRLEGKTLMLGNGTRIPVSAAERVGEVRGEALLLARADELEVDASSPLRARVALVTAEDGVLVARLQFGDEVTRLGVRLDPGAVVAPGDELGVRVTGGRLRPAP